MTICESISHECIWPQRPVEWETMSVRTVACPRHRLRCLPFANVTLLGSRGAGQIAVSFLLYL